MKAHLFALLEMLALCLLLARLYFYLVKPEQEPDAPTPRVPEINAADRYMCQLREAQREAALEAAQELLDARAQRG